MFDITDVIGCSPRELRELAAAAASRPRARPLAAARPRPSPRPAHARAPPRALRPRERARGGAGRGGARLRADARHEAQCVECGALRGDGHVDYGARCGASGMKLRPPPSSLSRGTSTTARRGASGMKPRPPAPLPLSLRHVDYGALTDAVAGCYLFEEVGAPLVCHDGARVSWADAAALLPGARRYRAGSPSSARRLLPPAVLLPHALPVRRVRLGRASRCAPSSTRRSSRSCSRTPQRRRAARRPRARRRVRAVPRHPARRRRRATATTTIATTSGGGGGGGGGWRARRAVRRARGRVLRRARAEARRMRRVGAQDAEPVHAVTARRARRAPRGRGWGAEAQTIFSRARRALLRYHASYCAAVGLLAECGYNPPSPRVAGGARGLARAPPPIPRALRVPEAAPPAPTSAAIEEARRARRRDRRRRRGREEGRGGCFFF